MHWSLNLGVNTLEFKSGSVYLGVCVWRKENVDEMAIRRVRKENRAQQSLLPPVPEVDGELRYARHTHQELVLANLYQGNSVCKFEFDWKLFLS